MRAVIIGAGLGGLLAGAFLAKNGYDVTILEKSPIIGGRFTNLPYKGFQLSTGALHMVPHGEDGPLAYLLKILGARVEIVNSDPKGKILWNGRIMHYREGWKFLRFKEKAKALKLLAEIKANRLPKGEEALIPADEWIKEKVGDNEFTLKFLESFVGWADSVSLNEIPAIELAKEIKAALMWGGPGLIRGGCKAVIDELARIITENNGKIITREKAVEVEEGKVISESGSEYQYDILISNIGVKETVELIGKGEFPHDFLKEVKRIKPSEGVKFNLAVPGEPRIGNTVVFTPQLSINGFNEPSSLDPSLAKEGYTLIMAHMALKESPKKAIKKGWNDLLEVFPDGEPLLAQVYRGDNPVNRTRAGMHVEWPLENIYVVGDGYRPIGGIEVDGIALGVMDVLERIGIGNFKSWKL
ncbi:NAD(P)-binding protein [Pyrococcus kukulkanii]|uniref:NAD(P)-binding protein n=1 Tax=Pyrococcus kukulkanii TaxID=1609559 RepID=A0ABV4T5J1_9EURY